MILYFKIGTLPGKHLRVCRLHKPPKVGQFFKVRDPYEKYAKHEGVHLLEICAIGGELLYVCERF
jgi:hypothetical protein